MASTSCCRNFDCFQCKLFKLQTHPWACMTSSHIQRGQRLWFTNKTTFLSLKIDFVLANSVDRLMKCDVMGNFKWVLVCKNAHLGVINIHRGSYMSAHVLLNFLNELWKRDKRWGLPSILSLFRNKFNKFNNTGAGMLDSIYHMTLTLFLFHIFHVKTLGFCHMCDVKSSI